MPNLSRYDTKTSRRSSYSRNCVSKNSLSLACSRPAAAASCMGVFEQNTIRVVAANVGEISSAGPTSHPMRQPVAAKDSKVGTWSKTVVI